MSEAQVYAWITLTIIAGIESFYLGQLFEREKKQWRRKKIKQ